ncbi:C4-TRAP dicarboxylate transporter periplasmatic binding protein [Desulfonema limicola]|uniref:C4-TRAP dicarboxylate transporter periplasmatic binding protein n=1 Tax=Desulfonema limicola TaxID=45656 RepID=A0A975B767_9BACT|nr:TRAP transporter substrate-binding protein [Desulfonema limicola]QTA80091.1 C4-TRAP dicarboxylate transporter periplasmatic binding protein [Desulfonema limicola]
MKKMIFKYVFAAFCICFTIGIFYPASSGAEITLTYSSFFPPTHIQSQLSESWCKEVEQRTEGRVKLQYYAGQTLTKAKQTYDSVEDGIADIGTSALSYTRGKFPLMSAVDLPFGYTSGKAATTVANELYEKFKPKEFKETKVLYFHAHGPGIIHTKGKAVRKLEDLKGLKVRSTGTSAEVVKALGGTPVPMPMPESYQSLQKGVVDGSMHPVEANKGWKLGEVVDYATSAYSAAYTTVFFIVMNKAKWDSLDPKDQKIIEDMNKEWAVKHGEAWDSSDMEGTRFFLQQGNEIIGIDNKESERWSQAVAPLIEEYSAELDKSKLDGKAVIQAIRDSLKKFE